MSIQLVCPVDEVRQYLIRSYNQQQCHANAFDSLPYILITKRATDCQLGQSSNCFKIIFIGHKPNNISKTLLSKMICLNKSDYGSLTTLLPILVESYNATYQENSSLQSLDRKLCIKIVRQRYLRLNLDYAIEKKIAFYEIFLEKIGSNSKERDESVQALLLYEISKTTLTDNLLTKPFLSLNSAQMTLYCQLPSIASKFAHYTQIEKSFVILDQYYQYLKNLVAPGSQEVEALYLVNIFFDSAIGLYAPNVFGYTHAKSEVLKTKERLSQELCETFVKLYDQFEEQYTDQRVIPLNYLEVGMILAHDLVDDKDNIILSQDIKVTEAQIRSLRTAKDKIDLSQLVKVKLY